MGIRFCAANFTRLNVYFSHYICNCWNPDLSELRRAGTKFSLLDAVLEKKNKNKNKNKISKWYYFESLIWRFGCQKKKSNRGKRENYARYWLFNRVKLYFDNCAIQMWMSDKSGSQFRAFPIMLYFSSKIDPIILLCQNCAGSPPKHSRTHDPSPSYTKGITKRPKIEFLS